MVRTWPKVRAKQFPFSKRRTNNFPFQTVREEGSQLYWTAHKPNWSPTSSLFSQEYIFCLHLVFTWHTIQPYNNFQIVNYKSTPKTGSPRIKVLYTLWSWTGTVRQEWLDRVLTKSGGWDLVGIGTLWTVDHHRARPGGYLFDQLGSFSDFWMKIYIVLDCICSRFFKQPRME